MEVLTTEWNIDNADVDFGHWNTTLGLVTNACWFFLTPIADAFMVCCMIYILHET
jgi:hypothetical protein